MRSRARWGYWVATISDFLLGIEKRGVTVTWYYFVKNFTRSYLGADQWPQGQRRRRRSHVSCDSCLMWLMSHIHCHDHFHASHPTMVWFRKLSGNNVEVSFDCVCYAFAVDVQPVHLCFFGPGVDKDRNFLSDDCPRQSANLVFDRKSQRGSSGIQSCWVVLGYTVPCGKLT